MFVAGAGASITDQDYVQAQVCVLGYIQGGFTGSWSCSA